MKAKIFLILTTITLGLNVQGQDQSKYGDTPEQIKKCKECLSLYREYRDQNIQADALTFWRCALQTCPQSSKTLYVDGSNFYGDKLDLIYQDSTQFELRDLYIDTLMTVYDMRIQYFGEEGKVLGRKAVDLYKYDKSRAKEANEMLDRAIELRETSTDANTVSKFYQTLYEMYRQGEATKSDLLVEYMPVVEILDYNIARAEDEKQRNRYIKAKNNLDAFFIKIAECDDIYRILGERLAATPNDIELNEKALAVMNKRDCSDNPLYLEVAERVYKNEPTAPAAYSIGIEKLKNKAYADALKYFEEAIKLCEDCIEINQYNLRAGQTASLLGQTAKSRKFANNILKSEPNNGEAYMLIGDAIVSSSKACDDGKLGSASVYWLATDYYAQAKAVDKSVAAKANQKINGYKKYFPLKNDIFFNNLEVGSTYTVECFGETTIIRSSD